MPDAGALVRRSTDLRTAVMTAMPEFRDTRLLQGSAVLRRTVEGDAPTWEADARKGFASNGWAEEPAAAGARVLVAGKEPFRLEVERGPRGVELRVSLPLRDGDVARILSAPISITTEQLALYLPRLEGTAPVRERFEVSLDYESFAFRTHWLVWQDEAKAYGATLKMSSFMMLFLAGYSHATFRGLTEHFRRNVLGQTVRPTLFSVARGISYEVREDLRFLARGAQPGRWSALCRSPFLRCAQVLGQYVGAHAR